MILYVIYVLLFLYILLISLSILRRRENFTNDEDLTTNLPTYIGFFDWPWGIAWFKNLIGDPEPLKEKRKLECESKIDASGRVGIYDPTLDTCKASTVTTSADATKTPTTTDTTPTTPTTPTTITPSTTNIDGGDGSGSGVSGVCTTILAPTLLLNGTMSAVVPESEPTKWTLSYDIKILTKSPGVIMTKGDSALTIILALFGNGTTDSVVKLRTLTKTSTGYANVIANKELTLNQWYNMKTVYSGASVKHYVNGIKINEAAVNINPLSINGKLTLNYSSAYQLRNVIWCSNKDT